MVQISALVALFAMGSSILATPIDISGAVAVNTTEPINVDILDNIPDGKVVARAGGNGKGKGSSGDMASTIIDIATTVFKLVWHISNDIERRKAFTQDVVRETAARFPGHNVVVCNVGYDLKGDGWQQVTSVTYDAKVGRPVTYDVVVFNSPKTFERRGDGGFQNWAYMVGPNCNTNGGWIDCPRH